MATLYFKDTQITPDLLTAFASKGADFTPIATILKSLIPNGNISNCKIDIDQSGIMTAKTSVLITVDNKQKWETTKLNAEQFETAIAPLTLVKLQQMIQEFTISVLQ